MRRKIISYNRSSVKTDRVNTFEVGDDIQHPGKENSNQIIFTWQFKKSISRSRLGQGETIKYFFYRDSKILLPSLNSVTIF